MERVIKVVLGCLLISLSILTFKHAQITTGGMAGLALNLSYLLRVPFDYTFFVVNLPFYILAIRKMGWNFTGATISSVFIVSFLTGMEQFLPNIMIPAWSGTIIGGGLMGIGLSILFSGKSSLGGTGVVTMYLQQRFAWDPGKINLVFDTIIIGSGLFVVSFSEIFFSALSIVIISYIISFSKKRIASTYISTAIPISSNN